VAGHHRRRGRQQCRPGFQGLIRPGPLRLQDSGRGVHRSALRLRHGGRAWPGRKGQAGPGPDPVVGSPHAAVVRYAILLIGGATIIVLGVGMRRSRSGKLLVGGSHHDPARHRRAAVPVEPIRGPGAAPVPALHRRGLYPAQSGARGGVTDGLVAGDRHYLLAPRRGGRPSAYAHSQVLAAAVGPIARPRPGDQSRSLRNSCRPASHPSRLMTTRRTAGRRTDRHDAPAQWCFASYLATTSAGMRPRSLTSIPLCLAQLRMAALCCR
jgi:hypothetical protein